MTEEKLEHLIADLLDLDREEVCRKLKPLRSNLISLVSQNTKITLKGILEMISNFLVNIKDLVKMLLNL